uniref:Uncharacterized protein n=1 Tax=Bracon brevicornis TaxID=1563983 RepID=A0A6V7J4P2_9HYME
MHVNQVLEDGDKLYRTSQARNKVDPGNYLTTSMIHPEFFIGDQKCLISVEDKKIFGNVFAESVGCPDFVDGLKRFFRNDTCAVVTAQGASVAVWRDCKYGYFYFDPAPCDESGGHCPDGTACVMRFKCVNDLQERFLSNLSQGFDSRYCIDGVNILRIAPVKRSVDLDGRLAGGGADQRAPAASDEKTIDCTQKIPKPAKAANQSTVINKEPLSITLSNYSIDKKFATDPLINQNAFDTGYTYNDIEVNIPSTFKDLENDRAILHGWTHELGEMYKGKGAQSVANCIASIAMKKINPVRSWLRPTLDDVLALGDGLFAETKAAKPNLKFLTAVDFNDAKVRVGGSKMFITVDMMTVVGTISSRVPSVLNLSQAVEEFFVEHKDGVIETSTMSIAVWMQEDCFYSFDPRECDSSGLRMIEEKGKTGGKEAKGAALPAVKKVKGKCCVIRFPSIGELVGHFLKNLNPSKKNDRFIIRSIIVQHDLPGLQPWYEFQPGQPGKSWLLQGTIANDAEEFEDETRGVQGLAMPIAALINATEVPPQIWTGETVDETIREGNDYFTWCIPLEQEDNRELALDRLKNYLYVKNRRLRIKVEDSTIVGNLDVPSESQADNLAVGMTQFFGNHQFGVLQVKNLAVAIWKFEEEFKDKSKVMAYYYFDPSPGLNLSGEDVEEEPGASVVRALDPAHLATLIISRIDPEAEGENDFFIHDFQILSIGEYLTDEELEADKQKPVKPDLNAYVEVSEDGACLNGSFDQANTTIFKSRTRNKQQAANALLTLAMRQLYNPHLWSQQVVDDILKLGDKLTEANIANIAAEEPEGEDEIIRKYLLPSEIEESFDIGVNRATVTLDEEKSRGAVTEMTPFLTDFFAESSMAILRQGHVMLPIWKEGDIFFMMDPRGRDGQGEIQEEGGTAAVLWFTTLESLAESLSKSFNAADEIIVDGVDLEIEFESRVNKEETEDLTKGDRWYNFSKKEDGVWELSGTLSISDSKFSEANRGHQSAAVAVVSIIFSRVYEPNQWTPEVIDEVVTTGDKLYDKSVSRLGENSELLLDQVITEFFLSNRRINITITDCVEAGTIPGKPPKVQNLLTGLENFFKRYSNGVLSLPNVGIIPIWKFADFYYCLIPTIRSENSGETSKPVSVTRFSSLDLLCHHIEETLGPEGDYEVSVVDVLNWNKLPPWKHDPSSVVRPSNLPPLNTFRRLEGGEARAILSGSIHQGSELFPPKNRNRQTAANCIVALGMSVLKDVVTWTKKTLDEILVIGNDVHEESLKFRSVEKLKPADIVRIFHVGANVLTVDVDQSTLSGKVATPPPEPEAKGKDKGKKKKAKPDKAKKKKGKQKREPPPPPPVVLLLDGLIQFFEKNRAGVLVAGRTMIALWKDKGVYFLYDPRCRNNQGLSDDSGAACTMWFACIEPLYDLIFTNLEAAEKYGDYSISRAVVRQNAIEPLPNPVGFQAFLTCAQSPIPIIGKDRAVTVDVEPEVEFHDVNAELSVLAGTINMNDRVFRPSRRGLQSTAMAAVAVVVGLLDVPSTWTAAIIDSILKYGDILHNDSVRMARSGGRNLSPTELLTVFLVGDVKAHINIHHHVIVGILQIEDVSEALVMFFRNYCAGILHTPNLAVAVMQHCGKYYMFDPSARNKEGRGASYSGKACVMKCESIMTMALIFVTNCNYKLPSVYTLNAVDVLDLKFLSGGEKCPARCEH